MAAPGNASLDLSPEPVAIVAGGGAMPRHLADAIEEDGRRVLLVALSGEADADTSARAVVTLRFGQFGALLSLLRRHGARQMLFSGSVRRRPDLAGLRPDIGAARRLPRILRAFATGDDGLLSTLAAIFEEEGLTLVGPLDVASRLAAANGPMGRFDVPDAEKEGLGRAITAAREIGRLDIGQAAVACGGRVVALEGAEGTADMLARVAELKAERRVPTGGVLAKAAKPQQDIRLDVPTIGPSTAQEAHAAGLKAVALEAGRTMLAGREETIAAFDRLKLALYGFEPPR